MVCHHLDDNANEECGTTVSCGTSCRESAIAVHYAREQWTVFHRKFRKKCPRMFRTLPTTLACLFAMGVTPKACSSSLDPLPGSILRRMNGRVGPSSARSGGVRRVAVAIAAILAGRRVSNATCDMYPFFRLDRHTKTQLHNDTTTRRHDDTTTRRNDDTGLTRWMCPWDPHPGTVPVRTRSLFFLSHGRFVRRVVVPIAPRVNSVHFFCVQRCDERRRRSEVILLKANFWQWWHQIITTTYHTVVQL